MQKDSPSYKKTWWSMNRMLNDFYNKVSFYRFRSCCDIKDVHVKINNETLIAHYVEARAHLPNWVKYVDEGGPMTEWSPEVLEPGFSGEYRK